mmetsp:Transcript_14746/g.23393  ORF Transcript_14746/g.23393 Transcript_14746/m.23393 type:complete len:271 (+) Transcript_14746:69-881(+)
MSLAPRTRAFSNALAQCGRLSRGVLLRSGPAAAVLPPTRCLEAQLKALDGRRWAASASSPAKAAPVPFGDRSAGPSDNLICGAQSNVGRLAGAIAGRVREKGHCTIDCVGAMPCYTALKAVVIASGYLTESHPGQILTVHPAKDKLAPREAPSGRITETVLTRIYVRPMPTPSKKDEPDLILIGTDTNAGLAAGLLSKVFETNGVAAVTGMGSRAMSQALKAVAIAQTYLQQNKVLDTEELVAAVRTESFKEGDEDRIRMVLTCMRAPAK